MQRQGVTHVLYNPAYYRWVLAHTDTPTSPLAFAMVMMANAIPAIFVSLIGGAVADRLQQAPAKLFRRQRLDGADGELT